MNKSTSAPFDKIYLEHYTSNETYMRKSIRDKCKEQLIAIREINLKGSGTIECHDITDYVFLLQKKEHKSEKYDFYYRVNLLGGAFIKPEGSEIIMHPHHCDKEDALVNVINEHFYPYANVSTDVERITKLPTLPTK
jgi:hypothetical protein